MEPTRTTARGIPNLIRHDFGFMQKQAWIARCKILSGLSGADVRTHQLARFDPCPLERQAAIIKAFRHFKMIS